MKYQSMQEEIKTFPIIENIKVSWGEMDAAKHVNNVVYLRWGETARIAYFMALGFDVASTEMTGFILAHQDCKYIFPVTYPDTIKIGVKVIALKADRMTFLSHFYSEKHQKLVAISKQVVVTYDYKTKQKVDMPEAMIQKIIEIEGTKPPQGA